MQTWAQVSSRARGGCVIHRCQNKNLGTRGCEWRHAPEACAEDFGGFEKSKLVESCGPKKKVDFREHAVALWRVPRVLGGWGCRWKSQNRKNVYLSPYFETFNSKVIKSFVPELRSRNVFFVFRDSYVLCIYVTNILCTFHISVSSYGTGYLMANPFLHMITVLFQTIQFCISTLFSFIWSIDTTLSSAATLGQSEPGSEGNERILCISQNSSITGTSPSDCLVPYTGH